MSNAKRAIMVPVLTLAVCAIAMVGLGFALTTSVTSSSNDVEVLMIDMAKGYNDLGLNAPNNAKSADSALDFGIQTKKTGDVVTYESTGGEAYLRIYGNLSNVTLNVKLGDSNTGSVGLTLYSVTGGNPTTTPVASALASPSGSSFDNRISCGDYFVKITSIGDLIYSDLDSSWSVGTEDEKQSFSSTTLTFTFTATQGNVTVLAS